MPIEATLLRDMPRPLKTCPNCHASFVPFMRGQVQRSMYSWAGLKAVLFNRLFPYCAVICAECKEIVGWE